MVPCTSNVKRSTTEGHRAKQITLGERERQTEGQREAHRTAQPAPEEDVQIRARQGPAPEQPDESGQPVDDERATGKNRHHPDRDRPRRPDEFGEIDIKAEQEEE